MILYAVIFVSFGIYIKRRFSYWNRKNVLECKQFYFELNSRPNHVVDNYYINKYAPLIG